MNRLNPSRVNKGLTILTALGLTWMIVFCVVFSDTLLLLLRMFYSLYFPSFTSAKEVTFCPTVASLSVFTFVCRKTTIRRFDTNLHQTFHTGRHRSGEKFLKTYTYRSGSRTVLSILQHCEMGHFSTISFISLGKK